MINVTKTFFPLIVDYHTYLEHIWYPQWHANSSALILELEAKLKNHLDVNSILITRKFKFQSNIKFIDKTSMSVSETNAESISCLALYVGLTQMDLDKICKIINSNLC